MFSIESSIQDLLNSFERFVNQFPFEVPWCVDIGRRDALFTTAIGSAIHGNEVGSLPALIEMLKELSNKAAELRGRYLFFVGNPDAAKVGSRFIERDLNRCFNLNDLKSLEGKRSQELAQVLSQVDLFIDYHQTNQPSAFPFFTFAYHEESYCWAAHMKAAEHFVTRDIKTAFSSEGLCGDEWVRKRGKPAVTLELGRAGLSHAAYRTTLSSLQRVIGFIETQLTQKQIPNPSRPLPADELKFFQVASKLPWPGDGAALLPGFENFQFVAAGTELGVSRPGEKIFSPVDGYLMFPKYPRRNAEGSPVEAQQGDLVQIIQPLASHPREVWK